MPHLGRGVEDEPLHLVSRFVVELLQLLRAARGRFAAGGEPGDPLAEGPALPFAAQRAQPGIEHLPPD